MDPSPDPTLRHRTDEVALTVLDPQGVPMTGTEVVVEQRSHAVGLGNIGFDQIPLANDELSGQAAAQAVELAALWLDLHNSATLPFYWGQFEPVRGRPDTRRLLRTARWFDDRGVRVKGHPLVWHTLTAPWLLDLPTAEVVEAQRARIRREVSDFSGVIDTWDAINEVVIMPVFDKEENGITRVAQELGRVGVIRLAFEEARATNPAATLLLNDFNLSADYEHLIEEVLEAGIQVDALGLQSHMHQGYWGEEKTLGILERFARFGLPLHLTETTLLSGDLMPPEIEDLNDYQVSHWPSTPQGEERQAHEVVRHYTTLLSHPSVESITYWGLSDHGAWLGAPVGLVRADGTPKPAYDALHGLVKGEWWLPPTSLRTDDAGQVTVSGWRGAYGVACAAGSGTFTLDGSGSAQVRVG
ncbi:endo-1,4-beta-xylanase [Actinotalea sp. K2]|uniref:endo-1,4-beta-xylanase n=1 Tax=Actinotalea sp. K2 TaxID=2939438 RepID=UPI002016B269|nr:endo-1,4-beta-xylanase [Actinotalea sp. K2]MCL3860770.1 endo-1,4-beta-xylanase [Actinotalea sp. K2]